MRLKALAAILALGTSALNARPIPPADQQRSADPRDLHHCKLRAARTADNDIRLDPDRRLKPRPSELPAPVARRILDHVTQVAKNQFTVKEWIEDQHTCDFVFSPIFRLDAPAGLQLYVAPRYFVLGDSVDYFFMYNPRAGAVTKSPPLIFTKWWETTRANDPLKKYPIVHMEDGRHGGPPILIVEERTHNGTVYDAAVYHYFEIGKDMSLTQILAVEARAFLLLDEYTERKATFLTPNRVRLDVTTRSPRRFGARGTVLLERSHSGQPFHVARRIPARGFPKEGLVTYCDSAKSDDDFLRVGCDFYY
ncbi:MAG TPA: hypothetical protein VKC17_01540 [Sphingomicrobium sp.]|nr:hypothetical protein [Sphingomicrobium sp.]